MDPVLDSASQIPDPSGAFLGIPYGPPLLIAIAIALVAVLALLWLLRGAIYDLGDWMAKAGRSMRETALERIAAWRAEEYQDRLMAMSARVRVHAQKLPEETGPIIARLRDSASKIELAAETLSSIEFDSAADDAQRATVKGISDEGLRNAHKVERKTTAALARTMKEQLAAVRPQLIVLKAEAPRVEHEGKRLERIHREFDANAKRVSDAYEAFDHAIHEDSRLRVASAARQSILMPWAIALFITVIALSGVFLNFFLIQRPMAEIVGEGARIGGIGLPSFAAMIVIFLEFVAGVVLMDAAGFTRIIPAFQGMTDTSRRIMFWVAFAFLAAFSFLEASLAIVREQIMETDMETSRIAAGLFLQTEGAPDLAAAQSAAQGVAATSAGAAADGAVAVPPPAQIVEASPEQTGLSLITTAQIILAVLIPWLLATAALPLETIVRNSVFLWHLAWANLVLIVGSVIKAVGQTFDSGFRGVGQTPADVARENAAEPDLERMEEAPAPAPAAPPPRGGSGKSPASGDLARRAS